jgi:hypothetical protein
MILIFLEHFLYWNVSACLYVSFVNSPISSDYRSESVETKEQWDCGGAVSSSRQQKTSTAASHRLRSLPSFLPSPSSPETAFVLIPQTAFGKMPFIHSREKRMQRPFSPRTALSFPSLTNRLSRMLFIHFRDLTVRPKWVRQPRLSLINIVIHFRTSNFILHHQGTNYHSADHGLFSEPWNAPVSHHSVRW